MEVELEFRELHTGTLEATFGDSKFIVYRKNYGWDWFVKGMSEKAYTPLARGEKYQDQLDVCGCTREDVLDSLCEDIKNFRNTYTWIIVS